MNNFSQASKVLKKIGLPAIIRPAFTLGGLGGGIAKSKKEFFKIIKNGLNESPVSQVLVEECLEGWKELGSVGLDSWAWIQRMETEPDSKS